MTALCMSGAIIFLLPFLREIYAVPLKEALDITNTQLGVLMSIFGAMSMLTYFPGGWLADRFSPRILMSTALSATGVVGFYYSTFPSYFICLLIHAFWGISISLVFWSAMIKATRNWASHGEQGRAFGFLEGGRGITEATFGSVLGVLFISLGSSDLALSQIIILYSVTNLLLAVLVWFTIDNDNQNEEQVSNTEKRDVNLQEIIEVLKMPEVWLISIVIMTAYSGYWGTYYFAEFTTNAFSASIGMGVAIAVGRVWINPFASISIGFISDKVGISRTICFLLAVLVITYLIFAIMPYDPKMMIFMVINVVITAFAVFAIRGIYFALLEEGGIPSKVTGTAAGIASAIGFLPDVYMPYIGGVLLDAYPEAEGYRYIYLMISISCFIGFIAAYVILRRTKNRKRERLALK